MNLIRKIKGGPKKEKGNHRMMNTWKIFLFQIKIKQRHPKLHFPFQKVSSCEISNRRAQVNRVS